jgi:hypothetical protein
MRIIESDGDESMKIPCPPSCGARTSLFGLLTALTLGCCSPFVYRADFQRRLDDAAAADLLGPYTGRVVDAGTDSPVPGATVFASWEFVRGVGFLAPAGAHTVALKTNRDGRYVVPRLRQLPSGATTAIARFRLVVYARGYVAYRSDRIFPGDEARYDFVQEDNAVRLEKWNPELSHADHLRFVGGGEELASASAWEVQRAAMQLDGQPPDGAPVDPVIRPATEPPLDGSALIEESDLETATGKRGTYTVGRLTDLPRSATYDSKHFKAQDKGERFDLAYRVWKLGSAAEAHYRRLLAAYPAATPRNEIGERSFRSHTADIGALVFLARQPGVVLSLTCGRDLCADDEVVLKLAKIAVGRLERLRRESTEPRPAPRLPALDGNPFEPARPQDPVLQ